eukprot:Gb_21555 [translate_table: standard]
MASLATQRLFHSTALLSSSSFLQRKKIAWTPTFPYSTPAVKRPLRGNNELNTLCREGCLKEALDFMNKPGIFLDTYMYASLLQLCANTKSLVGGMQVHAHIRKNELEQNVFLGTQLVSMYDKCGSVENARLAFDKIYKGNVFLWNAMIRGYAWNGPCEEALTLYSKMRQASVEPDNITFSIVLKACASLSALEEGKEIHYHIIRSGYDRDVFVGTALVDMYAKCGSIEIARQLFDKMPDRNIVSWSAMIAGYVQNGNPVEVLTLFHQMLLAEVAPNSVTMVTVLSAYADLAVLHQCERIHAYILKTGFESDLCVGNALIDMYAKCGSLEVARQFFDKMSSRNLVSWTTMISGYGQSGHSYEVLILFHRMQLADVIPNYVTIVSVLPVFTHSAALQHGKRIHGYTIKSGHESYVSVGNALADMYAKCESLEVACQVFDKMSSRDVISWNVMIARYASNGYYEETLTLFNKMQLSHVIPNSVTMISVLPACARLAALRQGRSIHAYIIINRWESDVSVWNALLDMYVKCGSIENAHQLFENMPERDVVSWNVIIGGYAQNVHINEALTLFHKMQLVDMKPDSVTMLSVLLACTHLEDLQQTKEIHAFLIRNENELDVSVGNALIDTYAKCGNIKIACQLFDKMSKRDVVSWNTMILGYAQNGHANEALTLFHEMQLAGTKPDPVTMASVVPVCAHLAVLQHGKWIHGSIIKSGYESDVSVGNALIDMYAKCGIIEVACHFFDKMSKRDVVSWNAIIGGYGMHGCGTDALALFYQMQQAGVRPNHITFVGILSACSHAGLVDEGWQHFDSMIQVYSLTPKVEHYACMVDLLGRTGHLDEAYNLIQKMPLQPGPSVWGAMLFACRVHCNIELGELVSIRLLELEPKNAGNYVLLSNMYAAAGRWDAVAKVRTKLKELGLRKNPGCSWIEIKSKVHVFFVG